MTRRETQTLPLICKGLQNKEIARELGVSLKTAEVYIHGCISHYGARSKTDLVIKLLSTEDPRDYL